MNKSLKFALVLLLSLTGFSSVIAKDKSKLNHDHAVGIHGMALFKTESGFVASHMPLHNSIHAYQVLLKLEFHDKDKSSAADLFKESNLISLVPEKFDLVQLIKGNLKSFRGNLVVGHFERGGELRLKDIEIKIQQVLLSEAIHEGENGSFYEVILSPTQTLLIHRIGSLPSFDQVFLANRNSKANDSKIGIRETKLLNTEFKLPPTESVASDAFNAFGFESVKQIYLETQDFQKR